MSGLPFIENENANLPSNEIRRGKGLKQPTIMEQFIIAPRSTHVDHGFDSANIYFGSIGKEIANASILHSFNEFGFAAESTITNDPQLNYRGLLGRPRDFSEKVNVCSAAPYLCLSSERSEIACQGL